MRLAWRNVSPNPPESFYRGASPKYHARHKLLTLQLDMADWFRPTWANYSSRISKADILATLREAKGATALAWEKGQKSRPRRSRRAALPERAGCPSSCASLSRARDGFEGSDLKTRRGRFRAACLRPGPPPPSPGRPQPAGGNPGRLAPRAACSTGCAAVPARLTQMFLRPF